MSLKPKIAQCFDQHDGGLICEPLSWTEVFAFRRRAAVLPEPSLKAASENVQQALRAPETHRTCTQLSEVVRANDYWDYSWLQKD